MIIGSSGFLGRYIYKTLKNRRDLLKDIMLAIDILQAEIIFKRAESYRAISIVSSRLSGISREFWAGIAEELSSGKTFKEAFKKCSSILKKVGLTADDIESFEGITAVLGRYDSFEQAQMLKNIKETVKSQWLESDKELKEKGKLYKALGLSFGIVIAIMVS